MKHKHQILYPHFVGFFGMYLHCSDANFLLRTVCSIFRSPESRYMVYIPSPKVSALFIDSRKLANSVRHPRQEATRPHKSRKKKPPEHQTRRVRPNRRTSLERHHRFVNANELPSTVSGPKSVKRHLQNFVDRPKFRESILSKLCLVMAALLGAP